MELIEEYKQRISGYEAFVHCLTPLLETCLREALIKPHSVTGRVKEPKSLEAKLKRPNKNYTSLDEVTDICGIRIITYFSEEVDKVARIVEGEFIVDSKNSVDKRVFTDPDRFGYASLHYVVSLSPARLALAEYRRFEGFKAEIQIRTVIQHAWAEIEHDLGYKRNGAIPTPVRRKFFRLAAILELADEEFTSIQNTLTKYEHDVGKAISISPETVEIDATSIREYINTSPVLKSCEEKICTRLNLSLVDFPEDMPGRSAVELRMVGLRTVNELNEFLKVNSDVVAALAAHRLEEYSEEETVLRGISLLYICYVILAQKGKMDEFMKFYEENGFGAGAETFEDSAHKIIAFVSQFHNTSPKK